MSVIKEGVEATLPVDYNAARFRRVDAERLAPKTVRSVASPLGCAG